MIKTIEVTITAQVRYESFDNSAKDAKAERQIKRWLRGMLKNEAGRIPLYINPGEETPTLRIRYTIV